MGCVKSTERKLYNEDVDIKRKFLVGIHFSKGSEGVEGNFQVAIGSSRKKKYKEVSTVEEENVQTPPVENVQDESVQGI